MERSRSRPFLGISPGGKVRYGCVNFKKGVFFLCVYEFQTPLTVTQSGTPEGRVMDGDEEQKMTAKAGVMLPGSQLLFSLPGSGISCCVEHPHLHLPGF